MSAPTPALLAAKLRRPAAPRHAVPRPALVARLNDGLAAGRPLTLIAAPAGYGKTTLAALVTTLLNDLDAAYTLNPSGLRRP